VEVSLIPLFLHAYVILFFLSLLFAALQRVWWFGDAVCADDSRLA
jgi:hypothetical protein